MATDGPARESAIDWRAFRIVPSRFPPSTSGTGSLRRRLRCAGGNRRPDQSAYSRSVGRPCHGAARSLGERARHDSRHGGVHAPEPGRFAILGWYLRRVLRGEGDRNRDPRDGLPPRAISCAYARAPQRIQMRCYATSIKRTFNDIRGGHPALHDPNSYVASQQFARELRTSNSNGVVYDSVRKAGGQCIAAFWPDCVGRCTQGKHYEYHWNGACIFEGDRDEGG